MKKYRFYPSPSPGSALPFLSPPSIHSSSNYLGNLWACIRRCHSGSYNVCPKFESRNIVPEEFRNLMLCPRRRRSIEEILLMKLFPSLVQVSCPLGVWDHSLPFRKSLCRGYVISQHRLNFISLQRLGWRDWKWLYGDELIMTDLESLPACTDTAVDKCRETRKRVDRREWKEEQNTPRGNNKRLQELISAKVVLITRRGIEESQQCSL